MTDNTRWFVRAQIVRWVDDEPQPGIVECKLVDIKGREWAFVAKFYDFTNVELQSDSHYPQAGYIACDVISRSHDGSGREIAEIDTDAPDRGRESEEGVSRFKVFSDQLVADSLPEWKSFGGIEGA